MILRKDNLYDVIADDINNHEKSSKLSYDYLYNFLRINKNFEGNLLVDYPFRDQWLANLQEFCKESDIDLNTTLVICSDKKLWKERFNQRSLKPLPNQLITDFDELEKYYGTLEIQPQPAEIVIDTISEGEKIIKELLKKIEVL